MLGKESSNVLRHDVRFALAQRAARLDAHLVADCTQIVLVMRPDLAVPP